MPFNPPLAYKRKSTWTTADELEHVYRLRDKGQVSVLKRYLETCEVRCWDDTAVDPYRVMEETKRAIAYLEKAKRAATQAVKQSGLGRPI